MEENSHITPTYHNATYSFSIHCAGVRLTFYEYPVAKWEPLLYAGYSERFNLKKASCTNLSLILHI